MLFWLFAALAMGAHIAAMWYIFGVLFPRILIGTLWVSGIALVEGFFLIALFLWLVPAKYKRRPRRKSRRATAAALHNADK